MKTTCELRFPDGQTAKAIVENESPQGESTVTYIGAVERIVPRFHTATNATLKSLFENLRSASGAALSVKDEGEFSEYAE